MNGKLLIMIVAGFGAIASYGFLELNDVDLDLQALGVIDSVASFTGGFNCACSDSTMFSEGGFDAENCNILYLEEPNDGPDLIPGTADDFPGVADPDSLGLVGNMLCLWESRQDDYGGNLNPEHEGCQSNSWKSYLTDDEYYWPTGFSPDYQFNDAFLTIFPDAIDDEDGYTLLDALKKQGILPGHGQSKQFASEAAAAILNTAHDEINYPYTVQEVIRMTQDAIVDEDYKDITKEFKAYNKLGDSLMCP